MRFESGRSCRFNHAGIPPILLGKKALVIFSLRTASSSSISSAKPNSTSTCSNFLCFASLQAAMFVWCLNRWCQNYRLIINHQRGISLPGSRKVLETMADTAHPLPTTFKPFKESLRHSFNFNDSSQPQNRRGAGVCSGSIENPLTFRISSVCLQDFLIYWKLLYANICKTFDFLLKSVLWKESNK